MALSFSLLVVRSEPYRLTSKAYTNEYRLPKNINLTATQWTTESNNLISYSWGVTGIDDATYQAVSFRLDCMCSGFDWTELRYNVIIRDNSYNIIYQGPNLPTSTDYTFTSNPYTYGSDTVAFRIQVLLFRADGGWLYKDYINHASLTLNLNVLEQVEENTLPAEWLTTVTNNIDNPFETMTTIVPPEMDFTDTDLSPLITIPEKITYAINMFLVTVGQLLQLKYMTFTISFILIVCLFAWLLH